MAVMKGRSTPALVSMLGLTALLLDGVAVASVQEQSANALDTSDASELVSLFGVGPADLGSIPADTYRKMMAQYTREYFRETDDAGHGQESFGFFKQKGSGADPEFREKLGKYFFDFVEIDFGDGSTEPLLKEFSVILRQETNIFRSLLQSGKDPLEVVPEHLDLMLKGALTRPRNAKKDKVGGTDHKRAVGSYIWRKLGSLGFVTGIHTFRPKQFHHIHRGLEKPVGSNMLVLIPGLHWGTKEDKVLIVGAHWDTVATSPGFNDNGSGVAALVELGRALSMGECKPKYTIVLVLFDLEEYAMQGSLAFVQDFLVKRILKPMDFPGVQGAYVIDSIMNFNSSLGSQLLPPGYRTHLPEATAAIERTGAKGDFLGLYSRQFDQQLSRRFHHHWRRLTGRQYRLERFDISLGAHKPTEEVLQDYADFLRSDHTRFWFANTKDYYASFQGILLADTGPARGVMHACYHRECDSLEQNRTTPFADIGFLSKVTQALIDSVVDASGAVCTKSRRKIEPLPEAVQADYLFQPKIGSPNMTERPIQKPAVGVPLTNAPTEQDVLGVDKTSVLSTDELEDDLAFLADNDGLGNESQDEDATGPMARTATDVDSAVGENAAVRPGVVQPHQKRPKTELPRPWGLNYDMNIQPYAYHSHRHHRQPQQPYLFYHAKQQHQQQPRRFLSPVAFSPYSSSRHHLPLHPTTMLLWPYSPQYMISSPHRNSPSDLYKGFYPYTTMLLPRPPYATSYANAYPRNLATFPTSTAQSYYNRPYYYG